MKQADVEPRFCPGCGKEVNDDHDRLMNWVDSVGIVYFICSVCESEWHATCVKKGSLW